MTAAALDKGGPAAASREPAAPAASSAGPARSALGQARRASHAVLAKGSKSFALAGKLLPAGAADDAAVIYAFCRHADDAIDCAPNQAGRVLALAELRRDLSLVYEAAPVEGPLLSALQEVARRRALPRPYLEALLDGFEMDVQGAAYYTVEELLLYCHRVAGTVGLLMCHVLGVRSEAALRRAAHLGIAMQLTNICRDVAEDWSLGRVYLPRQLFFLPVLPGGTFPVRAAPSARLAVHALLEEAKAYYRSADEGIAQLGFRQGLAVRTARLVYSAIGDRLQAQGCDVLAGRAVVPTWRKLWFAARAFATALFEARRRLPAPRLPHSVLRFPDDVLPL